MYGIPAAAAVGAPVPADQDFSQIAASPARNYVLVSAADTGAVSIYTPEHGLVPLDGAGGAPDSVVLSPRGSSAALWFSSLNQVQVITGLPDAPAIRQVDVPFVGSAPGALAISDDGAWVAGTWTSRRVRLRSQRRSESPACRERNGPRIFSRDGQSGGSRPSRRANGDRH